MKSRYNNLLGHEQQAKHDYLYWEFFELGGRQAILKGPWKAIKLNVRGPTDKVVFELYNHETDPMEWKNLASDPQYNAVKRAMEQYFPTVNVPEVKRSRPTN